MLKFFLVVGLIVNFFDLIGMTLNTQYSLIEPSYYVDNQQSIHDLFIEDESIPDITENSYFLEHSEKYITDIYGNYKNATRIFLEQYISQHFNNTSPHQKKVNTCELYISEGSSVPIFTENDTKKSIGFVYNFKNEYFQQFISPTKTVSTDAIIIAKTEKYTAFSERLESISWGITLTESSPWKFEEDKWHALYFCNFVLGNNDFKINMKKTFQ